MERVIESSEYIVAGGRVLKFLEWFNYCSVLVGRAMRYVFLQKSFNAEVLPHPPSFPDTRNTLIKVIKPIATPQPNLNLVIDWIMSL